MKRPRGNGLSSRICDVLADAPRPMFLGEIEVVLDFEHTSAEIMSVLVKLQRAGKVIASLRERHGPGRKVARAYCLSENALRI
ncbi:hypothetical protein LH425_06545 [Laribacter hongkongensis]|uniref:hypothetical protein n=1 Tax=Laribacter hongkongensis TaxID=168471 RepID=UPI001EFC3026|nr:hypothetical protein [Laribacter hongkongensis]MCG9064702.1 hypothetical protein [Laribacter hongkongensis]